MVSLAVAGALRRAWPEARIHMVVDLFAADAARGCPYLDQVIVYDRREYATGDSLRRLRAATQWLQRLRRMEYDAVFDLMGTPQTALWTRVTGAPIRVGRVRRFRSWAYTDRLPQNPIPRFAGEEFLDWVRVLGIDPGPWQPVRVSRSDDLDLDVRADLADLRRGGGPLVVINPSASWSAKAWPARSFARLAQLLVEQADASVLVAWGPGEETVRDAIVRLADGAARPLPQTDLASLACYLSAADLMVTTDSGPKHIAVAEDTPTLTVFGSTDPRGWQPPGAAHRWISHDVPCRPCNLTECTVPGHPCLDDLTPEQVLAEALRMLSASSAAS